MSFILLHCLTFSVKRSHFLKKCATVSMLAAAVYLSLCNETCNFHSNLHSLSAKLHRRRSIFQPLVSKCVPFL